MLCEWVGVQHEFVGINFAGIHYPTGGPWGSPPPNTIHLKKSTNGNPKQFFRDKNVQPSIVICTLCDGCRVGGLLLRTFSCITLYDPLGELLDPKP